MYNIFSYRYIFFLCSQFMIELKILAQVSIASFGLFTKTFQPILDHFLAILAIFESCCHFCQVFKWYLCIWVVFVWYLCCISVVFMYLGNIYLVFGCYLCIWVVFLWYVHIFMEFVWHLCIWEIFVWYLGVGLESVIRKLK